MTYVLHTVVVSHNRLPLLKRTIDSYYRTVTLPFNLTVVDNASDPDTVEWLKGSSHHVEYLDQNMYPGFATNHGFGIAAPGATLLHRSDNDMEYLPGWCDEIAECFDAEPQLGQLGLRTTDEEGPHAAVGGNSIIRRELWQAGLRYGERPWTQVPFEDALISRQVVRMGWAWARVRKPCTKHIGIARSDDPYYQRTFAERRITFAQYGIP